jgi:CRP/FNR family cyclic AMP-dependent transcriptional regulator
VGQLGYISVGTNMAKRATSSGSAKSLSGHKGKRRLLEAIKSQTLISEDAELARKIMNCGELEEYQPGDVLMQQGEPENDIFLLITGEVSVRVNSRALATRSAGTHVGEMALVDSLSKRSATIVAAEHTMALRVPEHRFTKIATTYPDLWRRIAVEIAKRLRERSKFLPEPHNEPVLFIGSSSEGQAITNEIYKRLAKKPVVPKPWTDGVFQASSTSIESLVTAAKEADFAALVLTADDMIVARGEKRPSPRDNVIFELGLFMGALGRERVFILKPKGVDVRIPSDLLGVVWLEYLRAGPKSDRLRLTCKKMWESISKIGPR